MRQINQILVDLDGVLANFLDAALALWDFHPSRCPAGQWEIPDVLGISNNEFWARIEQKRDFWRTLKPFPWTKELIRVLDETGIPWTVSTSPCLDPNCAMQKVEWMREHIGAGFTDYMIGKQKQLMANPGVLLIDDGAHNTTRFAAAGGNAIMWPAHWNERGASADPLLDVAREMKERFGIFE